MVSRREWLRITAGAGAAVALNGCGPSEAGTGAGSEAAAGTGSGPATSTQGAGMITREVPSSGEQLPVVGLGGANTFSEAAGDEEFDTMGANVLALGPRRALALEGNDETRRRLERAGVDVVTYRGDEISRKGDGGPTCLTRPLLRG